MYPNVCVICIAVIIFSLDNVAGCYSSHPKPSKKKQAAIDSVHPGFSPDSQETESVTSVTCAQRYQNGNQQNAIVLRNITKQTEDKTYNFIITVEKFDDNTEIYCVENNNKSLIANTSTFIAEIGANNSVYNLSTTKLFYNRTIIKVTAGNDTPKENKANATLKYNETQNVLFSCLNTTDKIIYVQLGMINTTSNMIETVQERTINQTFNIMHNKIILCCIYYIMADEKLERRITRNVVNKKMLVYDDGKNNGGKDSGVKDNGLQDTLKGAVNKVDSDTYPDDTDAGNQTKTTPYVPASAAVGAVIVILLFVVIIWRKRCRKKPKSDAKVLYADLDILRQTEPGTFPSPRPGPEEESPYAQIIGVMMPQ